MRILVLGGYGAMGQVCAEDLARAGATVIVAGRNPDKARIMADKLGKNTETARIDAMDRDLAWKIKKLEPDVLVNATWYEFNIPVMSAAIKAGVHYVDLGGLYHKTFEQLKFDQEAKNANVLCLLGMGSTPGTTNVMAAYGASKLDKIKKVEIRSGWRLLEKTIKPVVPFSARTIIDEFTLPVPILRNGRMEFVKPKSSKIRFTFSKPLGTVEGHLSIHSELATLPQTLGKGVREMDFAVAYPREFTRLVDEITATYKDREIAAEELQKVTIIPEKYPKDVDGQRVDIWGTKNGKKVFLRYDSITTFNRKLGHGSDMDTGVPPSIAAQWIAKGLIAARGVLPPEIAFGGMEENYFRELGKRSHMKIYEQANRGKIKPLN